MGQTRRKSRSRGQTGRKSRSRGQTIRKSRSRGQTIRKSRSGGQTRRKSRSGGQTRRKSRSRGPSYRGLPDRGPPVRRKFTKPAKIPDVFLALSLSKGVQEGKGVQVGPILDNKWDIVSYLDGQMFSIRMAAEEFSESMKRIKSGLEQVVSLEPSVAKWLKDNKGKHPDITLKDLQSKHIVWIAGRSWKGDPNQITDLTSAVQSIYERFLEETGYTRKNTIVIWDGDPYNVNNEWMHLLARFNDNGFPCIGIRGEGGMTFSQNHAAIQFRDDTHPSGIFKEDGGAVYFAIFPEAVKNEISEKIADHVIFFNVNDDVRLQSTKQRKRAQMVFTTTVVDEDYINSIDPGKIIWLSKP